MLLLALLNHPLKSTHAEINYNLKNVQNIRAYYKDTLNYIDSFLDLF